MLLLDGVVANIVAATGKPFFLMRCQETAGGCINRTIVVSDRDGRHYFVKLNDAHRLNMFEAEFDGLRELERARVIRVPRPICTGSADGKSFLVLEYLALSGNSAVMQRRLGQQLAALHGITQSHFGWHRSNTIGSTPQSNDRHRDWVEFYRERRLRVQLDLAVGQGGKQLCALGEQLIERVSDFFTDYRPAVSLLHGDLWSGNVAATGDDEPTVFDPAVYFGDREADIAMTELFGGFTAAFYEAYSEMWPLDAGYRTRKYLYNLYHILNHFNLFGGGYGIQAEDTIKELLSELR